MTQGLVEVHGDEKSHLQGNLKNGVSAQTTCWVYAAEIQIPLKMYYVCIIIWYWRENKALLQLCCSCTGIKISIFAFLLYYQYHFCTFEFFFLSIIVPWLNIFACCCEIRKNSLKIASCFHSYCYSLPTGKYIFWTALKLLNCKYLQVSFFNRLLIPKEWLSCDLNLCV